MANPDANSTKASRRVVMSSLTFVRVVCTANDAGANAEMAGMEIARTVVKSFIFTVAMKRVMVMKRKRINGK